MRVMTKWVVFPLLGVLFLLSIVIADAKKGQNVYRNNLQEICGMSAITFARMHTQDQWEAIEQAGKFADEIKKICPKLKKAKYISCLYAFVYEYASDSENIPSN